jgi:hypothetical protein
MSYLNTSILRLARAVTLCGLPALLLAGCLQPFNPPEISGGQGFLVVDGFLNAGGDTTTIRLSRSQNLADAEAPPSEVRAQVSIESDGGVAYRLTETDGGRYLLTGFLPGTGQQYRLRIRTGGSQEYLSEYVPAKLTPPIDSVSWKVNGDGVQLYVNTHNPAAATRYYRWEFTETWEFATPYSLLYTYRKGVQDFPGESTNVCWTSTDSRNIVLGTSTRLSEDIIYEQPLTLLAPSSEKHQIRYSILVRQYGLTREGYDYWQNLKRNTESLGTLFDPQPSQVSSNIRSVNNPEETVLGFFSAYSVQEKRIFISRNELPNWRRITGYESCFPPDTIKFSEYTPAMLSKMTFPVIGELILPVAGYLTSPLYCADCRTLGTNKKPPFW